MGLATLRWSVVAAVSVKPVPIARLSGPMANVCVGPPLLARGPRSTSATPTPTWLPFDPSMSPPLPPVPIKLSLEEIDTSPAMSSGVVLVFPQMMSPFRVVTRAPPDTIMPPPVPMLELPAIVLLLTVNVPPL